MDPRPIPNPFIAAKHKVRKAHIPPSTPAQSRPIPKPDPINIYVIGYPRPNSNKKFDGYVLEKHPQRKIFLAHIERRQAALEYLSSQQRTPPTS